MNKALHELLKHSSKEELETYIQSHPPAFNQVLKLALDPDSPVSWRAAWMVSTCMRERDPRVTKYSREFIARLRKTADGQQRELLNILAKLDIQEDEEGLLFDECVRIWEQTSRIASVRYAAFRILFNMAQKYPDLMHELTLLTESDYTDSLSPAIRKGVLKMMQEKGN